MNSLFVTAIVALIDIATAVGPFLLAVVWILRMKRKRTPDLRLRLGWTSLVLASAAFVAFFGGMFVGPDVATPMFDAWFKRWFIVCSCFSGAALLTGLVGKGRMQWAVVASAAVTPLACVVVKVLE
jgi:hypothetical protein